MNTISPDDSERLQNINMSIKMMMILENCSYSTAQKALKKHLELFHKNVPHSNYTVFDYCLITGRNTNQVIKKLANNKIL